MTQPLHADIFDVPANEYLRDLAERLRGVPPMYGTDGGDIDQLISLAETLEGKSHETVN